MTWNPRDSTRKVQMLLLFVNHHQLKPAEYAALVGHSHPEAYTYLRRHWRNGLLHKRRDWRGRILYQIAPKGAKYLLWWKAQYPDAEVLHGR